MIVMFNWCVIVLGCSSGRLDSLVVFVVGVGEEGVCWFVIVVFLMKNIFVMYGYFLNIFV